MNFIDIFVSTFEASMTIIIDGFTTLYPSIQGSVNASAVNVVTMSVQGLASLMRMCHPMLETFSHEQLLAIWNVLVPTMAYMDDLLKEIIKNLSSDTLDASSAELLEELAGVLIQLVGQANDLAGWVGGRIF